jgi:hypothetical protein
VPDNGVAGGFKSTASTVPATRRVWLLTDLDGDGRDDLIQTANPLAITPTTFLNGTTAVWRVWFNQLGPTALFSTTPTQWVVPASSFATPFSATAPNFWQLMDLDGDAVKELVQTADPAHGAAVHHARQARRPGACTSRPVERASRATATPWTIPTGPMPEGFRSISGASWSVLDVTGDGLPDLVQFQDPATGVRPSATRAARSGGSTPASETATR